MKTLTEPPKKDGGPLLNGPGVLSDVVAHDTPRPLEVLSVYALRGIAIFDPAAQLATTLGPDLFESPAERLVGAILITGDDARLVRADRWVRREAHRLIQAISEAEVPHNAAWAMDLIRLQAERRYGSLVGAGLRWSAGEAERGRPLHRLRAEVDGIFAVALGERPLDPAASWGWEAA